MGFELVRAIVGSERSFLFRMSSRIDLYTLEEASLEGWTEGLVLYWPKSVQKKGLAPIRCRLIRVPAKTKGKGKGSIRRDVWLLTDVLDPARRSAATAAKLYRWRWRNEGLFRTYKRTINKLKPSGRTVKQIDREAERSLLATQILLAHADLALRPETATVIDSPVISPRKVLIEIRKEIDAAAQPKIKTYHNRLADCRAEDQTQTSPKATREWPSRNQPFSRP